MSEVTSAAVNVIDEGDDAAKTKLVAAGGILGALGASVCCVIPLVLFSLGITGSWMANLTAFTPYKPLFIVLATGFLGYGFYLVYRKPKTACAPGDACARPLPNRLVKSALWVSTVLVIISFAWPVIIPVIAPYIFS